MSEFLNKTGVPNIENTIFRRLQNKYNHLPSQPNGTTIPSNSSQDSLYSIKDLSNNSELFFNGVQLTDGGAIGSSLWELDSCDNVITQDTKNISVQDLDLKNIGYAIFTDKASTTTDKKLYCYDASGTSQLFFGDVQLDSSHTAALWTTSGSNLLPNGDYGINMEVSSVKHSITNIDNLTAQTIAMIGTGRSITNLANISFTSTDSCMNNLKTLTFDSSNSTIYDLVTLNAENCYLTNVTASDLYGNKNDGTRDYLEVVDGDYLRSPEIQVVNGTGTGTMYSQQYYIGTPASNQSLANYIKSNYNTHLGTLTGVSVSAGIGGSPFGYLTSAIVPAQNISGYTDYNGLKCDVIECDEFLKANDVVCNNLYSNQGGGTDFFDFLTGTANAIGGIGNTIAGASSIISGGLVLGGGVATGTGLIAVAITSSGNGYYNQHSFNWESAEWNSAAEEMGMTSPYDTFGTRENGPTARNQMASFSVNPRSGRLTIATWGQTEDARALSGENVVQWCDSAYINSHDQQYSISFKSYSSSANYDAEAKFAPTCTYDGGNLIWPGWTNRLACVGSRLYFNGISNRLAYSSEIPAASTEYWELNGGVLQPNAASGFTGAIQINASVLNIFNDVYLASDKKIIFGGDSADGNLYWDEAGGDNLIFKCGDTSGNFKGSFNFLDMDSTNTFSIDNSNAVVDIKIGDLQLSNASTQSITTTQADLNIISKKNLNVKINDEYVSLFYEPPTSNATRGAVQFWRDLRTAVDGSSSTFTRVQLGSPNLSNYLNMGISNTGGTNDVIFQTTSTNSIFYFQDCKLKLDQGCLIENQTLTNAGLEASNNELFWNGSKIDHQSGSAYFTGSAPATSIADDFTFAQDVFVRDQFSSGPINSRINLTTSSANSISQITMTNLKRFVEYNTTAAQEKLNIDFTCGTDAYDNMNFRLGGTPVTYLSIDASNTSINNNLYCNTLYSNTGQDLILGVDGTTYLSIDASNTSINNNLYSNTLYSNTGQDLIMGVDGTTYLSIEAGNTTISNNVIIDNSSNVTLTQGNIDLEGDLISRSNHGATNICTTTMGDSGLSLTLSGLSSPDTFTFTDSGGDDMVKISTNDFEVFDDTGTLQFEVTHRLVTCYEKTQVNTFLDVGGAWSSLTDKAPLRVNAPSLSGTSYLHDHAYMYGSGGSGLVSYSTTDDLVASIVATGDILTFGNSCAVSDRRLKEDINNLDSIKSLDIISKVKPVEFKWKDKLIHGHNKDTTNFGFIAQDLENINNKFCKKTSGDIPNIMKNALHQNNYIKIDTDHIFKKDDEIIVFDDCNKKHYIKFIKRDNEGIFIDTNELCCKNIFVYGVKATDILSISKDDVFTMNVSATQELIKQNLNLQNKLMNLCNQLNIDFNTL
jgi:hypothetical protein